MGCSAGARAVSAVSTWGLKRVPPSRRELPGKIALYVDPRLIAGPRAEAGAGLGVRGWNERKDHGDEPLADALELAGQRVVCNRPGANLTRRGRGRRRRCTPARRIGACSSATSCGWRRSCRSCSHLVVVAQPVPRPAGPRGRIDRIQDSIVGALEKSPDMLVYNADDPLCVRIAERANPPHVRRTRTWGCRTRWPTRRCASALLVHVGHHDYRQPATGIVLVSHLRFAFRLDFAATAGEAGPERVVVRRASGRRGGSRGSLIAAPYTGAKRSRSAAAAGLAAAAAPASRVDVAEQATTPSTPADRGRRLQRLVIAGRRAEPREEPHRLQIRTSRSWRRTR